MIDTTPLTNGSGNVLIDGANVVNTASGGLFGTMLLIAIYTILFVSVAKFGSKVALTTTAFIGAIAALLIRLLKWINDPVFFFCIVILIIATLVAMNSKDG